MPITKGLLSDDQKQLAMGRLPPAPTTIGHRHPLSARSAGGPDWHATLPAWDQLAQLCPKGPHRDMAKASRTTRYQTRPQALLVTFLHLFTNLPLDPSPSFKSKLKNHKMQNCPMLLLTHMTKRVWKGKGLTDAMDPEDARGGGRTVRGAPAACHAGRRELLATKTFN